MEPEGNFDQKDFTPNRIPAYVPQPLPQKPRTFEEYQKRANHQLKPYDGKVVRKSYYELTKWSVIIFGIIALALGYGILNGNFKTEIPACPQCPASTPCPENVACPSCSTNLSCGNLNCGNISCNFPSSLQINLTNGTV